MYHYGGQMNFNEHLKKQLGFLERSCQSYDQGFHDEAIRIATVIRVLTHNTKSSTSLLKHLNSTTIQLLSTCPDTTTAKTLIFYGMGVSRMSGNGECSYFPSLGDSPVNDFVPVSKWWTQTIFILNTKTRLTRKDIVLAAANKDGGAHVDKKLSPDYEALSNDGSVGTFSYSSNGKESSIDVQNAHLVALRQMGFEILNSP
jgi:hypothetical protein